MSLGASQCTYTAISNALPSGHTHPEEMGLSIEEAWTVCADLYVQTLHSPIEISEGCLDRLEDELLFCLLGGFGITYELCVSATAILSPTRPFADHWSDDRLFEYLVTTLSSRLFEPKRRDGSLRKYRFPRRKAELILQARQWVIDNYPITHALEQRHDASTRREFLCTCPGIGLKTASWVIRNISPQSDVAILDVHIVRAMQATGRIGQVRMPRDYEEAESAFLDWCRDLRAPPGAFDLFLWEWQRGLIRSR